MTAGRAEVTLSVVVLLSRLAVAGSVPMSGDRMIHTEASVTLSVVKAVGERWHRRQLGRLKILLETAERGR